MGGGGTMGGGKRFIIITVTITFIKCMLGFDGVVLIQV